MRCRSKLRILRTHLEPGALSADVRCSAAISAGLNSGSFSEEAERKVPDPLGFPE